LRGAREAARRERIVPEPIQHIPFVVAILAGLLGQTAKVISFLIVEKRVNYRRFVQADGAPNTHTTTFSALTIAVAETAGFDSVVFALALSMTSIIVVDTLNVRNAASRQAEAVDALVRRFRGDRWRTGAGRAGYSYTPLDVFSGVLLGVLFALSVYR
jgi:acid phosphatase family membrane protein YuiD